MQITAHKVVIVAGAIGILALAYYLISGKSPTTVLNFLKPKPNGAAFDPETQDITRSPGGPRAPERPYV